MYLAVNLMHLAACITLEHASLMPVQIPNSKRVSMRPPSDLLDWHIRENTSWFRARHTGEGSLMYPDDSTELLKLILRRTFIMSYKTISRCDVIYFHSAGESRLPGIRQ